MSVRPVQILALVFSTSAPAWCARTGYHEEELAGAEHQSISDAHATIASAISARSESLSKQAATAANVNVEAHALHLAELAEVTTSAAEVSQVLASHPDLKRAVAAHSFAVMNATESQAKSDAADAETNVGVATSALIQRARATLGAGAGRFDKTLERKTACQCFLTGYRMQGYGYNQGQWRKLADLDKEGEWEDQKQCFKRCPAVCHSENKYMFTVAQAHYVGATEVSSPVVASKCEKRKCSCLDGAQTVQQAGGAGDIVHPVSTHNSPKKCLKSCAKVCDSWDRQGWADWEGLCFDYWNYNLAQQFQWMVDTTR